MVRTPQPTNKRKRPDARRKNSRISNPMVRRVFDQYPQPLRARLLSLRELILTTARETPGVGALEETLKWNEPAYVTSESKIGSTIRINRRPGSDTSYSMYFICHTRLVDSFRTLFPTLFRYHGDREIEFDIAERVPEKELKICIAMALTYHQEKRRRT